MKPVKYEIFHFIFAFGEFCFQPRSAAERSYINCCIQSRLFSYQLNFIMSDAPAAEAPAAKAPKVKKAAAPKKPAAHPPSSAMVAAALKALGDKKGSSRAAIKKYVAANYKVDLVKITPFLNKALKKGVETKALVAVKGSFKLAKEEKKPAKPKAKKAKKPKAKKPAAKKAKSPKKAKKPAAKKAKSPKKAAAKPKKAKTPKKAAAKPKPAKKAAAKKAPAKKAAKAKK